MLSTHFVPHNELHVFRGGEWQFSVAELRLRRDAAADTESLSHQFCLRAPGLDQVAFDVRDIRPMDQQMTWDPHLRVGRLTRLLDKCFDAPKDIVDAIAPYMCPLDASVRFATPPQSENGAANP